MPEYSQSTIHMRSPVSRKFSHSGSQWQADERQRVGGKRGAHGSGLAHHVVIARRAAAMSLPASTLR